MEIKKETKGTLKEGKMISETANAIDLYAYYGIEGLKQVSDAIAPATPYCENGKRYYSQSEFLDNFILSNNLSEKEIKAIVALKDSYQTDELNNKKIATSKKLLGHILLFAIALIATSCRGTPSAADWDPSYNDDANFLFFIPINIELTFDSCMGYVTIILIFFLVKHLGPGWHSTEIRNDIRDKDGNVIGSVGTGVEQWSYTSKEEAASISDWATLSATIIFTVSSIVSWIFPYHTEEVVNWILIIPLSILGIFKVFRSELLYNLIKVWKVLLFIICVICMIVYHRPWL